MLEALGTEILLRSTK